MSEDIDVAAAELAAFFPPVDCGHVPLGTRVVVQLRAAPKKKGSIILVEETVKDEDWNNQVAKVIALGELAYRNRATRERWPEGAWGNVGDFVRVPRWGGDRWTVAHPSGDKEDRPITFVTFGDMEIIAKVTGDVMAVRSFILD